MGSREMNGATTDIVREEARRRIRSKPDFFASLSPDALEMIRTCDGPERLGGPGPEM
jgi:hypothetical protein